MAEIELGFVSGIDGLDRSFVEGEDTSGADGQQGGAPAVLAPAKTAELPVPVGARPHCDSSLWCSARSVRGVFISTLFAFGTSSPPQCAGVDVPISKASAPLALVKEDQESNKEHGITTLQATLSLITAIIGAGVMALPQLPSEAGLIPSMVFTVFSAVLMQECGGLLHSVTSSWNACHNQQQQLETFEDFGRAALGHTGAVVVRISVISWFIGVCAGYVILMARQLQLIAGFGWNYRVWVLVISPVLWLGCMLRDLTAIAKLMPVGVVAAIGSCVLMITKAYMDVDNWQDWPEQDQAKIHSMWPEHGFMPLGSVVATLFGAFGVMGNVPTIAGEMRQPRHFPRALKVAMCIVMLLYLGIMVSGYWGYGNFIQDNILISMSQSPANAGEAFKAPVDQWTGPRSRIIPALVAWCVLVNLLLSYPLNMMCIFTSIQSLESSQQTLNPGTLANYGMRTGLMGLTIVIALAVENFSVVFSLFAALTGPLQGVFIPVVFGGMVMKKIGAEGTSLPRRIFHAVIMLYAAFCLVIGTVDAVTGVIESFTGQ